MIKRFLLLFLVFGSLGSPPGWSQSNLAPLGTWQVHAPNNQAVALARAGTEIYVATEGGFFVYHTDDNQLKILSKVDGFTENRVRTLGYDPETKTLVIVYRNTQIDLLQERQVTNLSAVARKNIPGLKEINQVYIQDKVAYLATSFGVVVVDLVKKEVRDTYSNLGPAGEVLQVFASTLLNDSLYLATSRGVLAARRSNTNLLDFRNWKTFTAAEGLPAADKDNFRSLATFRNKVYAGVSRDALYRFNGQTWTRTPVTFSGRTAWELKPDGDFLYILDGVQFRRLHRNGQVSELDGQHVAQPRAALADGADAFWLADYQDGLVRLRNGQTESLIPNGPKFTSAFRAYSDNRQLYLLGGGYDQAYEQRGLVSGFSVLNGRWENFNTQEFAGPNQFPPVRDLVAALRNPVTGKFYLASYGGGLVEWEGPGQYKVYDPGNSPLLSSLPGNNAFTRVTDLAADAAGSLWLINRHQIANAPGLHALRPDGTWKSFNFPGFPDGGNLERLLIDGNGFKWMNLSRRPASSPLGLLVFDDQQNQYRYLNTNPVTGNLPGLEVYALALDKNQAVWVGTDKGVAVFYDPGQVFAGGAVAATLPIIQGRPLLENQVIRALAVDGANRKWIGTDSGLWLISPDGDAVVSRFTAANSPLPSDNILDIAVNGSTGEVLVVTAAGVASYRGTATETTGKPDCAMVYPNPVRPGYSGLVGISGLPNGGSVKITDLSGALVYQTTATGGSVAWDLRDLQGRRVRSGVYLAFSASPDGSQSCISKIAVVD